jgi:hypothetical protein
VTAVVYSGCRSVTELADDGKVVGGK